MKGYVSLDDCYVYSTTQDSKLFTIFMDRKVQYKLKGIMKTIFSRRDPHNTRIMHNDGMQNHHNYNGSDAGPS